MLFAKVLVNTVGLTFGVVTSIFFLFPPFLPVITGTQMNWTVVVIAVVLFMATVNFILDGRKHYQGPREISALLEAAASTNP